MKKHKNDEESLAEVNTNSKSISEKAHQALGIRILTLLFLVRSHGNQVYGREIGLREIQQRLIGTLGRLGPMTSSKLGAAMGMGKPQTSHATTTLVSQGLISRKHHRAPFELTPAGEAILRRMSELSARSHALVTVGIGPDDLQFLSDMVAILTRHGEIWLAEEQMLSASLDNEDSIIAGIGENIPASDALIPSLVTMSMLMQRNSFLVWKRTVGIAPFHWVVLSRVAGAGRLRLNTLVEQSARDKGQVWRVVNRLVEDGLLLRHSGPGSRDVELTATAEGERIYGITAQYAIERDALIAAALGNKNCERFRRLIEVMISNAQKLLRN